MGKEYPEKLPVGDLLNAFRLAETCSVPKLAERIASTQNSNQYSVSAAIRRIENGEAIPTIQTMQRIISGFGWGEEDLWKEELLLERSRPNGSRSRPKVLPAKS